jgi:hypothetical protein
MNEYCTPTPCTETRCLWSSCSLEGHSTLLITPKVISLYAKAKNCKGFYYLVFVYSYLSLNAVTVKVRCNRPRRAQGGVELQPYSFVTSALEGIALAAPRSGRFTPGKIRYPLYRKLGGTQGRSGLVRKILPTPGFDPQTVQPVASRFKFCSPL